MTSEHYAVLGYVVSLIILAGYALKLFIGHRRLNQRGGHH
jgi:hypothetical protein